MAFGHFQGMLLVMKILNWHCLCGGSNEPLVITGRSVDLRASSMAQVGSSLEKKVTPEQFRPYQRAVPSVSRSGGRVKGKSRILTLTPEKERFRDLCQEKTKWDSEFQTQEESQNMCYKTV
jgi:hypothetical protein